MYVKKRYESHQHPNLCVEAVDVKYEGKMPFKITDIKCDRRWVAEVGNHGITISCKINDVPCKFPFEGARWGQLVGGLGIDCNEVLVPATHSVRPESIRIATGGGGQNHYALFISDSVVTSQPKENQKDFRFIGQLYSTAPIVKAFKPKLMELYDKGLLTQKFLECVGAAEARMLHEGTVMPFEQCFFATLILDAEDYSGGRECSWIDPKNLNHVLSVYVAVGDEETPLSRKMDRLKQAYDFLKEKCLADGKAKITRVGYDYGDIDSASVPGLEHYRDVWPKGERGARVQKETSLWMCVAPSRNKVKFDYNEWHGRPVIDA